MSKLEVENLLKVIKNLGYIYSISLLIEEPSSAITVLNYCTDLILLKSITIVIKKTWSFLENVLIGKIVKELKKHGIKVNILSTPNFLISLNFI